MGEMYTGETLEKDVLGSVSNKEIILKERETQYLKYLDAIEEVKQKQPAKKPHFAKVLEATVNVLLHNEKISSQEKPVRFYTAVGTSFDIHHGVDGFFEAGDKRVTIDITSNPKKDKVKADLMLFIDPANLDTESNPDGYKKLIRDCAFQIKDCFMDKITLDKYNRKEEKRWMTEN